MHQRARSGHISTWSARTWIRAFSGVAGRPFFSYQAPAVAIAPTILVFDSGLGGLTVYREVAKVRPDARYVYVADDAFFPYNGHDEAELVARVVALMDALIESHRPDLIVIACNTASTIVDVALVGSARLAGFAEAELDGEPVADHLIAQEMAPCFIDKGGRRTDTIVLACTHYPLLLARLNQLAPWPVTFIDPAPAIARRVADLSGPMAGDEAHPAPQIAPARIVFTSGRAPSLPLRVALARFGIGC